MENGKKPTVALVIIIIVVLVVGALYLFFPDTFKRIGTTIIGEKPKVIEENLVVPNTQKVSGAESRIINQGPVEVPLVPESEGEKVIVEKAVLTAKSVYNLSVQEARNWSNDSKLAFIKSFGAVTLEGKSSQWQAVFSSKLKPKRGYEVIIQGDSVVSKKEIESTATGGDVPANLKDSGDAIKSLQELPQFSSATISSITLYYNTDGKVWRYSLATSRGGTSMSAQ